MGEGRSTSGWSGGGGWSRPCQGCVHAQSMGLLRLLTSKRLNSRDRREVSCSRSCCLFLAAALSLTFSLCFSYSYIMLSLSLLLCDLAWLVLILPPSFSLSLSLIILRAFQSYFMALPLLLFALKAISNRLICRTAHTHTHTPFCGCVCVCVCNM